MSRNYYTYDLNLASVLVTLGVPLRREDPVTCVIERSDKPQDLERKTYNFWFDTTKESDHVLVSDIVRAHNQAKVDVTKVALDVEHPFFYARAALDNRGVLMNWIRNNVVPMNLVTHGDRTLLISSRACQRTKDLMHGALKGDFSKKE